MAHLLTSILLLHVADAVAVSAHLRYLCAVLWCGVARCALPSHAEMTTIAADAECRPAAKPFAFVTLYLLAQS